MISSTSQAEDYQLGQGWNFGNYSLSGYTNIETRAPNGAPVRVVLDDLSLFVGGHTNRWINPFIEAEISRFTLAQQGGVPSNNNGSFMVERLYNEAILSEHDTLRVGKILTPFGDWNLIHAEPLVPTITRPLTTSRGFHAYMSGISWHHDPKNGFAPGMQLYWQPGTEWLKRPSAAIAPRSFRNVSGGHINIPLSLIDKIGVSFQHGQLIETGENFTIYGINIRKYFGDLMVESEAVTSLWSGAAPRAHDHETGIFGLADYSITSKWHSILEWEHYQDHTVNLASRNTLVAVSYAPEPPIIWKLEYIYQSGVSPTIRTGWKASFAALF